MKLNKSGKLIVPDNPEVFWVSDKDVGVRYYTPANPDTFYSDPENAELTVQGCIPFIYYLYPAAEWKEMEEIRSTRPPLSSSSPEDARMEEVEDFLADRLNPECSRRSFSFFYAQKIWVKDQESLLKLLEYWNSFKDGIHRTTKLHPSVLTDLTAPIRNTGGCYSLGNLCSALDNIVKCAQDEIDAGGQPFPQD